MQVSGHVTNFKSPANVLTYACNVKPMRLTWLNERLLTHLLRVHLTNKIYYMS